MGHRRIKRIDPSSDLNGQSKFVMSSSSCKELPKDTSLLKRDIEKPNHVSNSRKFSNLL